MMGGLEQRDDRFALHVSSLVGTLSEPLTASPFLGGSRARIEE